MKKIGENKYLSSLLFGDTVNKNGRIYSIETLNDIVKQFGELDHPIYGEFGFPENLETNLSNVSHRVNKVFMSVDKLPRKKKKKLKKLGLYKRVRGGQSVLFGEIEMFNSKFSKILTDVVARPRGIGNIGEGGVISDYKVLSFDLIPKQEDAFEGLI